MESGRNIFSKIAKQGGIVNFAVWRRCFCHVNDNSMKTYAERERACEIAFEANGPFWHVYTDGTAMADIFSSDDEQSEGMIALAVCAILFNKVELVTFELMNNHVHLIMRGAMEDCLEFFEMFKKRLKRWSQRIGKPIDWSRFNAQILEIETLRALRNEIIYTNRNAYIANRNYHPYNYPWGGGWAYFNSMVDFLPVMSIAEMGSRRMRDLTHYRDVEDLKGLLFVDDVPFIPSFCRIDIGMSMYQDARSYFHALTRNAEAQGQIAARLKDSACLTDEETFVVAARCAEENFGSKLRMLTPSQKIELARKLHYDYNATNSQLRRVLNLELAVLDEMFPPSPESQSTKG